MTLVKGTGIDSDHGCLASSRPSLIGYSGTVSQIDAPEKAKLQVKVNSQNTLVLKEFLTSPK